MSKIFDDIDNVKVAAAIANLNSILMITDDTEVDMLARMALLQLTVEFTTNDDIREEAAEELKQLGGNV